jgi:hypothetical protein
MALCHPDVFRERRSRFKFSKFDVLQDKFGNSERLGKSSTANFLQSKAAFGEEERI